MINTYNDDFDDAWGFTLADICLTLMIVVVITIVCIPAKNNLSTTVIEKEMNNDIFWKFSVIDDKIFVETSDAKMHSIKEDEVTDCIIRIQQNNSDNFNGALQTSITFTPESSGKTVNTLEHSIYNASKNLGYKLSPFISKIMLLPDNETANSSD